MSKMTQMVIAFLAISAVIGIGMAVGVGNVSYNSDIFGNNAPYISMIDPRGDKVTVTNPGSPLVGQFKFVNVFGQTVKNEGNITLTTGDTTFNVSLSRTGNIGIHTAYYVLPTKEQVALGMLGIKNNDDLAMASIVTWLPGHDGVYKLGKNGVWGWINRGMIAN